MARAVRLGGEDAAWLHTDTPDNPMVVTGLLELDGPVGAAALERVLRERLLAHARFRSRVVEPWARVGRPRWEALERVDLDRHVFRERIDDGGDEALRRRVGEIASVPLPADRPLWRIHVLERPGAGSALVFRVHHAVADGFALEAVLLSLCDHVVAPIPRHPPSTSALAESRAALRRPWRLPWLAARFAASLVRLLTHRRDRDGVLKGRLGAEKRVAWTRPLPLAEVHDAAARAGVTVNDLIVAAVSGALRDYCVARGAEPRRPVKAMVPVNLRTPQEALDALGTAGRRTFGSSARNTSPICAALSGRCAGSFSRQRSSSRSTSGGISGRTDFGRGAGCSACIFARCSRLCEWNGSRPVKSSNSTTPSE